MAESTRAGAGAAPQPAISSDDRAELARLRAAEAARAEAEAAQSDDGDRPDETVEGGRYMVGGQLVNAEGAPIKDAKRAKSEG